TSAISMKLVAFDGDDTLWTPLDILNLSDRTPTDAVGWPDFSFKPITEDRLIVQRDDGPRFALRPETRSVMETLRAHGILVGVMAWLIVCPGVRNTDRTRARAGRAPRPGLMLRKPRHATPCSLRPTPIASTKGIMQPWEPGSAASLLTSPTIRKPTPLPPTPSP